MVVKMMRERWQECKLSRGNVPILWWLAGSSNRVVPGKNNAGVAIMGFTGLEIWSHFIIVDTLLAIRK
jgi:hypothetical protein